MLNLLCIHIYLFLFSKIEKDMGKVMKLKVEKEGKIGLETLFWFGLRKAKA